MSRELLQELTTDARRLFAGGTTGVAGDPGLRRRGTALASLAAQVPALAPVAGAVGRLLQGPPSAAGAALCDLLSLTRQLQASLATAGCDGKAAAVEKSGPWQTVAPVRDVVAWGAASFHADSNDLPSLRGAVARPDFADLRLVQPLLKKLPASGAGEDEDLLSERALPAFGSALLPDLRGGMSPQGGIGDARRLRAICALDPKQGATLCRQALADGSTAVKVQALRLLARLAPADAERAALEVLAAKGRWELREAAIRALADSRDDRALDALLNTLGDKNDVWGVAWDALARLRHPRATARLLGLLAELRTSEAEATAARGKKGKGKSGPRLDEVRETIGRVARVLGERKDAAAVPALVELLAHKDADVREVTIEALCDLGDLAGLRAAAERMDDAKVWQPAARAAWLLPARERYQRLAPLVEELLKANKAERRRGKTVLELFEEEFSDGTEDFDTAEEWEASFEPKARRTDWDARWVPLLRKLLGGPYRAEAAVGLAAVLGPKAVPELLPLLAPSVKKNECGVAEALGYLRAREAVPAMVGLMPGQPSHHYCIHDALRRINDPAAISLLEGILAKTKDRDRRDCIAAVINYLETHRAR